jgi:hypothetical protein
LVDRGVLNAAVIRDQVRRSQVYGWYFLPAAVSPVAFPESVIDFRDQGTHDIHTLILGQQITGIAAFS